ncbi:SMAD/FHA domain-containing protein [Clavulina sp. PMI_390]|nr:SMAD/FHA domain-containing protein [Clavulina sp. PMI_390]
MQAFQPPQYPALVLYPTTESSGFSPKMIAFAPTSAAVPIGRAMSCSEMMVPAEQDNGYFPSKVMSRKHAQVWEENGKIFLRDVKSTNGTFINGERLSAEGIESEARELKNNDCIYFGINVLAEDKKTIVHRRVAATVMCIVTPEDFAQLSIPSSAFQHTL